MLNALALAAAIAVGCEFEPPSQSTVTPPMIKNSTTNAIITRAGGSYSESVVQIVVLDGHKFAVVNGYQSVAICEVTEASKIKLDGK